jgi:hypothetical protein
MAGQLGTAHTMGFARCAMAFAALGTLGVAALLLATARTPSSPPPESASPEVLCRAELHSWVVSRPHPGRHLFLEIDCPAGYEHLNGRVEFTSAALRRDYAPAPGSNDRARVARMTRGGTLVPLIGDGTDTRLEGIYELTVAQAECLQRDRMFEAAYVLLGPNSTSGMLAALRDCGCGIPAQILRGGGWLGEFPGAELTPGAEVPPERWAGHGVPTGPTPIPAPAPPAASTIDHGRR